MKEIKSFYTSTLLIAIIMICSVSLCQKIVENRSIVFEKETKVIDTNYGSFLAAQHALFINDFDTANKLTSKIDSEVGIVVQTKNLTDFLIGKIPQNIDLLKNDKDLANMLIYDAFLLQKDDWESVYKRHSKDASLLMAPVRIFSALHEGNKKEVTKFLNSLKTSKSWKAFVRGQIAVLNNDIKTAAKEFADVDPGFMNINDYLYLMSFYQENDMDADMDILRDDFIAKTGGMYILNYPEIPDWKTNYAGYKNNLAFSIIQTISHAPIMVYTDLSLMMLRFAQAVVDNSNSDAINYYLGQYFFHNLGDYEKHFNNVAKDSPLYLFGQMKIAEKAGDIKRIKAIANKNPLFIPAVNVAISNDIQNGDKNSALRIINRALKQKDLPDTVRMFFLKQRANIHLMFNSPKKAQKDIDEILDIDYGLSSDILSLQARTWVLQNKKLDDAYDYAMMLVKRNVSDVTAWDLLGVIVEKREGVHAALELLEKVGEVSVNVSSLYEHLGDFYKKIGNKDKARESYLHAIDLSNDGLVVVPFVQRKIRILK